MDGTTRGLHLFAQPALLYGVISGRPHRLLARNLSYTYKEQDVDNNLIMDASAGSVLRVRFNACDLRGQLLPDQVVVVAVLCEAVGTGKDFKPVRAAATRLDLTALAAGSAHGGAAAAAAAEEQHQHTLQLALPQRRLTRPTLLLLTSDLHVDLPIVGAKRARRPLTTDLRDGPTLLGLLPDPCPVWAALHPVDQLLAAVDAGSEEVVCTAAEAPLGPLQLKRCNVSRSQVTAPAAAAAAAAGGGAGKGGKKVVATLLHVEQLPEAGKAAGRRGGSSARSAGAGAEGLWERPAGQCPRVEALALSVTLSSGDGDVIAERAQAKGTGAGAPRSGGGGGVAGQARAGGEAVQEVVEFRYVFDEHVLSAARQQQQQLRGHKGKTRTDADGFAWGGAGSTGRAAAGRGTTGSSAAARGALAGVLHEQVTRAALDLQQPAGDEEEVVEVAVAASGRKAAAAGAGRGRSGSKGEAAAAAGGADGRQQQQRAAEPDRYFVDQVVVGADGACCCPLCPVVCRGFQGLAHHLPSSHGLYVFRFAPAPEAPQQPHRATRQQQQQQTQGPSAGRRQAQGQASAPACRRHIIEVRLDPEAVLPGGTDLALMAARDEAPSEDKETLPWFFSRSVGMEGPVTTDAQLPPPEWPVLGCGEGDGGQGGGEEGAGERSGGGAEREAVAGQARAAGRRGSPQPRRVVKGKQRRERQKGVAAEVDGGAGAGEAECGDGESEVEIVEPHGSGKAGAGAPGPAAQPCAQRGGTSGAVEAEDSAQPPLATQPSTSQPCAAQAVEAAEAARPSRRVGMRATAQRQRQEQGRGRTPEAGGDGATGGAEQAAACAGAGPRGSVEPEAGPAQGRDAQRLVEVSVEALRCAIKGDPAPDAVAAAPLELSAAQAAAAAAAAGRRGRGVTAAVGDADATAPGYHPAGRRYFHSRTGIPASVEELFGLTADSDDDETDDEDWEDAFLRHVTHSTRHTPLLPAEQRFFLLWSAFLRRNPAYADYTVPVRCLQFVRAHGQLLRSEPALRACLSVHLLLLHEYNLVDPRVMHRCLGVADGRICSSLDDDLRFLAALHPGAQRGGRGALLAAVAAGGAVAWRSSGGGAVATSGIGAGAAAAAPGAAAGPVARAVSAAGGAAAAAGAAADGGAAGASARVSLQHGGRAEAARAGDAMEVDEHAGAGPGAAEQGAGRSSGRSGPPAPKPTAPAAAAVTSAAVEAEASAGTSHDSVGRAALAPARAGSSGAAAGLGAKGAEGSPAAGPARGAACGRPQAQHAQQQPDEQQGHLKGQHEQQQPGPARGAPGTLWLRKQGLHPPHVAPGGSATSKGQRQQLLLGRNPLQGEQQRAGGVLRTVQPPKPPVK